MTCEPHVQRELEAELDAERAAVRADALEETAARVLDGPYPPAEPVVDVDAATITVPLNLRGR